MTGFISNALSFSGLILMAHKLDIMCECKSGNPAEGRAAPQVAAAVQRNGNSDWQNGSNNKDAKSDSSPRSSFIRVEVIILSARMVGFTHILYSTTI